MADQKIYDKYGNAYDLQVLEDEAATCTYEAYDGKILAGVVRAHRKSREEIFLDHILITKFDVDPKTTGSLKAWWNGGKKPLSGKYRNRGLGTFLLLHFIEDSYQRGFELITASVSKADIEEQPFLLDWYERHGFIVRMLTNPEGTTAAALRYITKSGPQPIRSHQPWQKG